MAGPSDVIPVSASPLFQSAPLADVTRHEEADTARAFQEINARRAELERPELLRTIRAL